MAMGSFAAEYDAFNKRKFEMLSSEYKNQITGAVVRAKSASTHDKGAEQQSSR